MALKRKRGAPRDLFDLIGVTQWSGAPEEQRRFFDRPTALFDSVTRSEQLDVDLTILDYVVYQACDSLIKARRAELEGQRIRWEEAIRQLEMAYCELWPKISLLAMAPLTVMLTETSQHGWLSCVRLLGPQHFQIRPRTACAFCNSLHYSP